MSEPGDTVTCFHHRDRPTGRACTRCGRPACPDCLRQAAVGSHCFECLRAERPPAAVPPAAAQRRQWRAGAGPVTTKAIVGINVAVFLACAASSGGSLTGEGGSLTLRLALFGPAVHDGEAYRLLTSGFVHYGLLHILFNMVILYRFGELLESALGPVRLSCLYVASLLGGSFGALLLSPHALTGGASGAVFGLVAAAAIGLHQRGVNVWQSGVGGLIVVNLVLTFVIPGISIGGHLGGLAAGFAVGAFMLRTPPTTRHVVDGALVAALVSALAVAGSLFAAGR